MRNAFVLRTPIASFSLSYSSIGTLALGLLFCITVLLISLCVGNEFISPAKVLNTLFANNPQDPHFVVETLRLPRTLMAAMVGAALGSSGLVLQSMIRNPLASPDIIGITGGASAAAICFLSLFSASVSLVWLPIAAIFGALISTFLIYALAWRGGISPMRLVLVGIGISSAMGAITTFMIAASPLSTSISAYIWLTGSVYGANWDEVKAFIPWLAISWPCAFYLARRINVQELGDGIATGLGISVQPLRLMLLLLSVTMAAPAIAYAGAIGFVGLIAPHIARFLVPRSFAHLMPMTAIVGACLVMLADLIGRILFQPLDIPAGVFVSAIGAPFFIYLLYKQRF